MILWSPYGRGMFHAFHLTILQLNGRSSHTPYSLVHPVNSPLGYLSYHLDIHKGGNNSDKDDPQK